MGHAFDPFVLLGFILFLVSFFVFFSYKPAIALYLRFFGVSSAGVIVSKDGVSDNFYLRALSAIRRGAFGFFFSFYEFSDKEVFGSSGRPDLGYYSMTVKFHNAAGKAYGKKFICTKDTYDKYDAGHEISVTYIKNNPELVLLKEYIDVVTSGWWILLLGIIGGIVVLIFKSF